MSYRFLSRGGKLPLRYQVTGNGYVTYYQIAFLPYAGDNRKKRRLKAWLIFTELLLTLDFDSYGDKHIFTYCRN